MILNLPLRKRGAFSSCEPVRRRLINRKILISACLLGDPVRYDGASKSLDDVRIGRWLAEKRLIKYCPEIAGGLSTPRPAAEIHGADGNEVLRGNALVVTFDDSDLSDAFIAGAQATLCLVQKHEIKLALLKSNSPSCGNEHVYNGHFNNELAPGIGVTTALLRQHGVQVFNEWQLDELEQAMLIIDQ